MAMNTVIAGSEPSHTSTPHLLYTELHAISNYSFLRGASHPEELVEQAAQLGYQGIAITDECSLAGVVKAHSAAKQVNIKLIIGSEFHLQEGLFVVLVPNRRGYAQLSHLITSARRRAKKGCYQLNLDELLEQLSECFVLWRPSEPKPEVETGQIDFQTYTQNINGMAERLQRKLEKRLFLLMERTLQAGESLWLDIWQQVAEALQIECVAAGDVHMHLASRRQLLDVLTCIRTSTRLSQLGMEALANSEQQLKPLMAIAKRYPSRWLANSQRLAQQCHFSLDELRYEYPSEITPQNLTPTQYLRQEVELGAKQRFGEQVPNNIQSQYRKELAMIEELGYEYFFLTIYDIVKFAKRAQILHQGRGSAANSVVCYCLGITEVDPTKVSMLFERFISKERNEPPDIDVDFEHSRREEVIQYIYQKYGRDRAALAATVISYRFKSALADVGKALDLAPELLKQLQAGIDRRDPELSWQSQLINHELIPKQGMGRYLPSLMNELIGFPRHLSQHVGGFIISAGPLSELVPIENAAMKERSVIQWDKDDLESLGLLKVDILALGMLSAIRRCFELLSKPERPFGMAQIVWEQQEVYDMLQRADAIGVFQVESRAQMSMLPRLRPNCYYDLVVQIAIVRPGPIQGDMVHPYLRRRHGLEQITYPSKEVEQVLSRTLGVPIFQEQVIKLAMVAAGFSGGEADQLRRAMASWKRSGQLQQFERKLLAGMSQRGYSPAFAQQIFQQIKGFGEYGFPESHSASFALLAYVSAYLKCHYPAAFTCALLNSQPMGFYTPSQLVQDAKRHGVQVLPVCVQSSLWQHTLERIGEADKSIESRQDKMTAACESQPALRLGLSLVKGLSQAGAERLVHHRQQNELRSLADLYACGLNKQDVTALADANALTSIVDNRYQAHWEIAAYQPNLPLFEELAPLPSKVKLATPSEVDALQADYHHIGLSLGKHPMALLRESGILANCRRADELMECRHGQLVTVAGVVTGRQRPGTATGVTFITLEDETGNISLVVWAATAKAQRKPYLLSNILKAKGVLEYADGVAHVIAGKLEDISSEMKKLQVKSRDFR